MAHYSKKFKAAIVKKALLPNGPSISIISEETDIPIPTIYSWLKKQRRDMDKAMSLPDPKN